MQRKYLVILRIRAQSLRDLNNSVDETLETDITCGSDEITTRVTEYKKDTERRIREHFTQEGMEFTLDVSVQQVLPLT